MQPMTYKRQRRGAAQAFLPSTSDNKPTSFDQPSSHVKHGSSPTPPPNPHRTPKGEPEVGIIGIPQPKLELVSTERGGTPGPSTKAEKEGGQKEGASTGQADRSSDMKTAEHATVANVSAEASTRRKGKKDKKDKEAKPRKKRHQPVYMGREPRDSSEARLAWDRAGETSEMTAAREAEVEAFSKERLERRAERLARNAWKWLE